MSWLLEEYFRQYRFSSFAEYLGLGDESSELPTAADPERGFLGTINDAGSDDKIAVASRGERTPITIVVPCYNEESALPYLSNTLKSVQSVLQEKYDVEFVFVDDGSTDSTRERLNELFGHWAGCRVIRHDGNKGVAAAILTGIRSARTDIVCSIDCDCTYDPHELWEMVPKLTAGVDLVTASPYHPLGQVRNVPSWRLALSKTSSWLYRRVLRQKLFTYTSCFRVYRRTSITDLQLDENGFLGIAEMVGRLDLKGANIVEHPATLEVRLFGYSKMKTVKTIAGHLRLLSRLLSLRLRNDKPDKTSERRPKEVAGTHSRL
jgi:glycosyltransferase involved in cell wall biosynthesis